MTAAQIERANLAPFIGTRWRPCSWGLDFAVVRDGRLCAVFYGTGNDNHRRSGEFIHEFGGERVAVREVLP